MRCNTRSLKSLLVLLATSPGKSKHTAVTRVKFPTELSEEFSKFESARFLYTIPGPCLTAWCANGSQCTSTEMLCFWTVLYVLFSAVRTFPGQSRHSTLWPAELSKTLLSFLLGSVGVHDKSPPVLFRYTNLGSCEVPARQRHPGRREGSLPSK